MTLRISIHEDIIPDTAAVNVAQVPVVYQVPPLMMQPSILPLVVTGSVPLPENGLPGVVVVVGLGEAVVAVDKVVEGGVPVVPLGRYFTPVAGQFDLAPSEQVSCMHTKTFNAVLPGFVGTNVPV